MTTVGVGVVGKIAGADRVEEEAEESSVDLGTPDMTVGRVIGG